MYMICMSCSILVCTKFLVRRRISCHKCVVMQPSSSAYKEKIHAVGAYT